jgi:hypothetical protein
MTDDLPTEQSLPFTAIPDLVVDPEAAGATIGESELVARLQEEVIALETQRQNLVTEVDKLAKKRDRLAAESQKTFSGNSQEIALRLQGFKDYLTGSLQDLVAIVEEVDLPVPTPLPAAPVPLPPETEPPTRRRSRDPKFAASPFQENAQIARDLLTRYQQSPDYYAPAWQLRRGLDSHHLTAINKWLFQQNGRGALPSFNTRLQNVLVAAAVIAIFREMYADRLQVLILAEPADRVGEWRRAIQNCLGLNREDFGPGGGMMFFDSPEIVAKRAERIENRRDLPLIIVDSIEDTINLSLLQYPLWLAFIPDPQSDDRDRY